MMDQGGHGGNGIKHMKMEREQMTARAPVLSRKFKAAGGLAAGTLADLQQRPARKWRSTVARCTRHRWLLGRFTRRCCRCGLEDVR